jgi:membrane protease subunit HflK
VNPEATLRQVTESVERGVVGSNKMDFVLTEGRSEIVSLIKKEIQEVMDSYQAGIQITSVNLQDAQPPEQVQSAFEDAIKAREDKQRLINEAEAYANDVVPKARGAAARKLEEAEGYRQQVIAQAEGEVSRFSQLLSEYQKAPEVTRQRLYLDAMEIVLTQSNTALVDIKNNSLMYLPLDKLTPSLSSPATESTVTTESSAPVATSETKIAVPTAQPVVTEVDERGRSEDRQRFSREQRGRE